MTTTTKPTESVDLGKNGIIALANSSGIDTDTDGDIWGSTNGAIFKFADALITLARRAPAQQDADERAKFDAIATLRKYWVNGSWNEASAESGDSEISDALTAVIWGPAAQAVEQAQGIPQHAWSKEAEMVESWVAAQAVEPAGQRAVGEQPEHETIIQEGDKLVCTACGTSSAGQAAAGPVDGDLRLAELDAKAVMSASTVEVDRNVLLRLTDYTRRYLAAPTVAAAGPVASDWEIGYDEFTTPGTIRLHHPKWGGCFLPKPVPGDIRLPAMFYRLAADTIDTKLSAAPLGEKGSSDEK